MTYRSDEDYHLAREGAERLAAERAASVLTRNLHLSLADRHADRAWSIGEGYRPGGEDMIGREATDLRPDAWGTRLRERAPGMANATSGGRREPRR